VTETYLEEAREILSSALRERAPASAELIDPRETTPLLDPECAAVEALAELLVATDGGGR
jgi:hypothetical protein